MPYVCDGPSLDYFETLETNRELLEQIGTTRAGTRLGRAGASALLHRARVPAAVALAEKFDTGIHTHSSEQVARGRDRTGASSVAVRSTSWPLVGCWRAAAAWSLIACSWTIRSST